MLKKEGVNTFTLQVIPLTENYYDSLEHCLEQYFLLQSIFNLNILRVVNKVSGRISLLKQDQMTIGKIIRSNKYVDIRLNFSPEMSELTVNNKNNLKTKYMKGINKRYTAINNSVGLRRDIAILFNSCAMTSNNILEMIRFYSSYTPVVKYPNTELQKSQILEENKGKSGIYI